MINFPPPCQLIEINSPSETQADELSNFLYLQTGVIDDSKQDFLHQWKLRNKEAHTGLTFDTAIYEDRQLVSICTITFLSAER